MKPLRFLLLICAYLAFAPVLLAAEQGTEAAPATGTVAETIEAGGYVYLKLEEQGIWIAANTFKVSMGDKIQYSGGMEMKGFHSKSLDRTFDSIYFVSKASLVGQGSDAKSSVPAMPAGHGGNGAPLKKPVSAEAPSTGEIKHLKDGQTVESIFAGSAGLKEQVVSLNAKVIKINKAIMGRNWITLQDGTGTDPEHKILATSQEEVSPGDIVVAKGTVKTDVDLGYGYTYKVLLEEVTFSKGVE